MCKKGTAKLSERRGLISGCHMVDFDNFEQNGSQTDETESEMSSSFGEAAANEGVFTEPGASTDNGGYSDDDDIISEVTIQEIQDSSELDYSQPQPTARPFQETAPTSMNEYIYNDYVNAIHRKRCFGKVALWIFVAVLATAAVSYTSIFTYISIVERNSAADSRKSDNFLITSSIPDDAATPPLKEITQSAHEDRTAAAKDVPTLEQLAAPKDAMLLPDIYDKVSPSVVGVSCARNSGTATGTGIIISDDGYIITNAHVLKNAVEITIVDNNLNEYIAEVIGSDAQTDLAVLKINGSGLTACEFGKSADLRIGELSVVIGNPLGFDLYGTMTTGIISGLNRTVTIGDNTMTLIQTQASINKGNSGGPLINCYGQVIGITSAKVDSAYGEGLGFAIPIDEALPILKDLMEYGYVTGRPMIGFNGENITAFIAMYYRLPQGALVRFVTPDSGAEKAGLKSNDIIIGFNGETVTTMEQISEIVNQYAVGDTITLTVYRDGVAMDIEMVLGEITSNDR